MATTTVVDPNFESKFKSKVTEILPNTERVKQRIAKQKLAEKTRQQEIEKVKAQKEREEKLKLQLQMEAQQKQAEIKKRQEEEERRQKEESALISTLQGKFGQMINDLKTDDTRLDYTISGLGLKDAQVRILLKALEKNKTLKGLSFIRKHISDMSGKDLFISLKENDTLERLEFEGNQLGPETCASFGQLLRSNTTIRVIDLEGNNLTNLQKLSNQEIKADPRGIQELAKALEQNTSILCLNLANTGLESKSSEILMKMLEHNTTLINLDIDANPHMNLQHIRAIQKSLLRNKEAYDKERYSEFLERKQMWRELNISNILQANREAKKVLQENINTRIEAKRQQMDEQWQKKLEQEEALRQKQILKLQKESQARKKGKKRSKKKKK